jgi:hypothetical protein
MSVKYDNKLNEIFNLESEIIIEEQKPLEVIEIVDSNITRESDIKKAKEVHYDLIDKSQEALKELLGLAKISESPRAYEVLSNLIKTTSEVTKTLLELDKEDKKTPETQNNTQNNLFFGSTAELQKLLKG